LANQINYSRMKLEKGVAYVKEGTASAIKEVDAVIFDCDGVLIDARRSYDRAIKKSVKYIFRQLVGTPLPREVVNTRLIYCFRKGGGFNSDWDTVYATLLGIFSQLPPPFIKTFQAVGKKLPNENFDSPTERLSSAGRQIRGKIDGPYMQENKEKIASNLLDLASNSDSTGIKSVEGILFNDHSKLEGVIEGLKLFKEFLRYPGSVMNSIVSRVFDEFFYGSEFFQEVHGLKPSFRNEHGLIEEEEVIVEEQTLSRLSEIVGHQNLAIASGRGLKSTKRTLQGLMNFINSNAMVFMEDEESYMNPVNDERANLGKPQPYSLLTIGERLRFTKAIYVGDSTEDLFMVKNANRIDDRFLFAGIFTTGFMTSERLEFFKEQGTDLLLSSVNILPGLLGLLRGLQK
jgi:phosphoglycolate phosphatase-like HAD superfamily hydrolase